MLIVLCERNFESTRPNDCGEIVRLLLEAGANPSITNRSGVTAESMALTRPCYKSLNAFSKHREKCAKEKAAKSLEKNEKEKVDEEDTAGAVSVLHELASVLEHSDQLPD